MRAADYRFTDHATGDLQGLVKTYNDRQPGLGEELAEAVLNRVEQAIVPGPRLFSRHPKEPSAHICRLPRFPVRIVYFLHGLVVVVIAVEHMRELPDKWRTRLLQSGDD